MLVWPLQVVFYWQSPHVSLATVIKSCLAIKHRYDSTQQLLTCRFSSSCCQIQLKLHNLPLLAARKAKSGTHKFPWNAELWMACPIYQNKMYTEVLSSPKILPGMHLSSMEYMLSLGYLTVSSKLTTNSKATLVMKVNMNVIVLLYPVLASLVSFAVPFRANSCTFF